MRIGNCPEWSLRSTPGLSSPQISGLPEICPCLSRSGRPDLDGEEPEVGVVQKAPKRSILRRPHH